MIYEVLTTKRSRIWISNYEKTCKAHKLLTEVYSGIITDKTNDIHDKYLSTRMKRWYTALVHGMDSPTDVMFGMSTGKIFVPSGFLCTLRRVPGYTVPEMNVIRLHDGLFGEADEYAEKSKWLTDLGKHWAKYAAMPFQVEERDVQNYLELCRLHETIKQLLIDLGKYDEALNLVEDC